MGAVQGHVRALLRLEGFCILLGAALLYQSFKFSWLIFLICFMLPDLSMLAYVKGPRIGAAVYNAAHCYIGPLVLLGLAFLDVPAALPAALVWLAHIGFCRAFGFGLKYASNFADTHLGPVPLDLPALAAKLLGSARS